MQTWRGCSSQTARSLATSGAKSTPGQQRAAAGTAAPAWRVATCRHRCTSATPGPRCAPPSLPHLQATATGRGLAPGAAGSPTAAHQPRLACAAGSPPPPPLSVPCRFTYCALLCCTILGRTEVLNTPAAVDYILACKNFDGGFGCRPGGALGAGRRWGAGCGAVGALGARRVVGGWSPAALHDWLTSTQPLQQHKPGCIKPNHGWLCR